MSEDSSSESARSGAGTADRRDDPPRGKDKEDAKRGGAVDEDTAEPNKDDRTPGTESPRADAEEYDGPVSEKDALLSLTEGIGRGDAERSEALRAGAIADEIARRLSADASGTHIGTLALFNADVSFGGGFHAGGARSGGPRPGGVSVLAIDAADTADHTELFVAPEDYGEALDALCERRVLVLTGVPGSGREAAAVNLLGEALAMAGGGAGCHRLLTPATVLDGGWEPPVKHSGYLAALDDGSPVVEKFTSAFLSGHSHGTAQWAAVVATLRATGCFLVLTGGHDLEVLATGPGGDQVARHALAPVDPLAVVERRVLGHSAGADATADLHSLLERTGATTALREQPSAGNAAWLASKIRADADVAAAVAQLRDPSEQVRAWFNQYGTPDAVAFALAAAVLEDCGYLTVADAAVKLRAALTEPESAPPDVRFGDRLGHEQQWIRLDLPAKGSFGAPRVRFRNALLGQVILAYAWNLLDGRRDAVLDWLRRLLSHRDLDVRARAAVAAGVLALADPHYAVHRFLTTWAGSTSWPLRQGAATALSVAGSRPETAEAVWDVLHQWARGDASAYQRRLAGTAAHAVGGLLGRTAPGRAVAVLRSALDREDDWGTLPSVAWGGVHLIHQGQTSAVLDAYLEWSEPQDLSPMVVKSLSAFVFAVSQPYEEPVLDAADGRHVRVPGVPVLLGELPRHRARLAELWARALARRPVQDAALDALHRWIDDYAGKSPGSLDAIEALLVSVAGRPGRHRERLTWWLEKWARDREKPSAGAARLLRALVRSR
ncbi:hypothetical protein [Streptomyces regalis]|uniref:Uncharacterized protein n=1 Tax=Streptomyces regalis TaxID=68262 RepID=A0A0X3VFJ0_9ACTN|nr:hypothetical protein [Streptomyces regalis]KUL43157.1 hypothetical protein ADL12_08230 [Streptomyces regalis]